MALRPEDYTVAWISVLSLERAIACELLDEEFPPPQTTNSQDDNCYTFGRIQRHNVVITCLPKGRYGITATTHVVRNLQSSFPAIRFALLVGIAGGVPTHGIRLGDVVVSAPTAGHGGVFQYDYGKTTRRQFEQTGYLTPPPQALLNVLSHIETLHKRHGHKISARIEDMFKKNERLRADYSRPSNGFDRVYKANYIHQDHDCDCLKESGFDTSLCVEREKVQIEPVVHYGLVASANQVMKDAVTRDELVGKHPDILCFEMEAAGVMNSLSCIVIRGICDYSDSHKNELWQGYAAATAAAYAKELLEVISTEQARLKVTSTKDAREVIIPFRFEGFPVSKKFVGRSKELQKIEENLLHNGDRRRIFVLHGSGGMGKTQLAVKFMCQHQNAFNAVFWLNGSTEDSLKLSLAKQVRRLPREDLSISSRAYINGDETSIDTVVEDVLNWLASGRLKNWLVIYDEVDRDPEESEVPFAYDIEQYLPKADHGSILITTRQLRLKQLGGSHEVTKVDTETARMLLDAWSSGSATQDSSDALTARLLERLDGLPLAISQAGAFLDASSIGVQTYLELYDKEWDRLAGESTSPLSDYSGGSVWTTWRLSFDTVAIKDRHAANLLLLWSYFDCKDFWHGLFAGTSLDTAFAQDLKLYIGEIVTDKLAFIEAMKTLRKYSLIEICKTNGGFSMHPVIHHWVSHYRKQLNIAEAGRLALTVAGLASETAHDSETEKRILPHAQACCASVLKISFTENWEPRTSIPHWKKISQAKGDHLWRAVQNFGKLFYYYDRLEVAEAMLNLLLTTSCTAPSEDREKRILRVCRDLAIVYYQQRKFSLAEDLMIRTLNGLKTHYGPHATITIRGINNLAWLYGRQGKQDKSIDLLKQARKAIEESQDTHEVELRNALHGLGVLYLEQGKIDDAEEMLTDVMKQLEQKSGSVNYGRFLRAKSNLSWVYAMQGKLAIAESFLTSTLQGFLNEFGADHEDTLLARHQLAGVYLLTNNLKEAEEQFLEILQRFRSRFISKPRTTSFLYLRTLGCLGCIYQVQKKWWDSRIMYQEALSQRVTLESGSSGIILDIKASLLEVDKESLPNGIESLADIDLTPNGDGANERVISSHATPIWKHFRDSYKPSFQVFWRSAERYPL